MIDLTQIVQLLSQLGPYGWAAAALLIFIRYRSGKPILPFPVPGPSPSPAPQPVLPLPGPNDPAFPLVDLVLQRMRQLFPHLFGSAAAGAETIDQVLQKRAALSAELARRREAIQAELAKLAEVPLTPAQ